MTGQVERQRVEMSPETASQVTEVRPGAVQATVGRQGATTGMEYQVGNQHLWPWRNCNKAHKSYNETT